MLAILRREVESVDVMLGVGGAGAGAASWVVAWLGGMRGVEVKPSIRLTSCSAAVEPSSARSPASGAAACLAVFCIVCMG